MRKIILGRKFALVIVHATCIVRFLLGLIIISLKVTGTLIETLASSRLGFHDYRIVSSMMNFGKLAREKHDNASLSVMK